MAIACGKRRTSVCMKVARQNLRKFLALRVMFRFRTAGKGARARQLDGAECITACLHVHDKAHMLQPSQTHPMPGLPRIIAKRKERHSHPPPYVFVPRCSPRLKADKNRAEHIKLRLGLRLGPEFNDVRQRKIAIAVSPEVPTRLCES
ncbi:peptidase [Pseudozyma hubeiensis SY62]|uniref:Peptidase n=1 Tax=Pseudozyma hubeiensis (strain SY62) TaxID=1305764 RepID=R9PCU4_PSEHS|nr:peptidase [Pseudozyma hubeiensis SY62]GAC95880.1 peptidase [Pseudozyma hubeiensis SY62]